MISPASPMSLPRQVMGERISRNGSMRTPSPRGQGQAAALGELPCAAVQAGRSGTMQGKNMPLYKQENLASKMPDDTLVKYFTGPEVISVLVDPRRRSRRHALSS